MLSSLSLFARGLLLVAEQQMIMEINVLNGMGKSDIMDGGRREGIELGLPDIKPSWLIFKTPIQTGVWLNFAA